MAETVAAQMTCPKCGAPVPVFGAFVSWCPACDWNVDPTPEPKQNFWDRHFSGASARTSQKLFERLAASGAERPPRRSLALNMVAAAVHLLTGVTFVGGVLLLVDGFAIAVPFRILFGALALIAAFFVQPFWRRRKKPKSKPLKRDAAPTLFELVDEVAKALGCRGLDGIRITADFNTGLGHTQSEGWVMRLGLGFWSTLSEQQRVALIGHELGHQINHDQRKSLLVQGAVATMQHWSLLLNPAGPGPASSLSNPMNPLRNNARGMVLISEWFAIALMLPLSMTAAGLAWMLHVLGCRQGLAAEYYADTLSANVAGTDAAVGTLERALVARSCANHLLHTAKFDKTADPWVDVASYAASIPATEVERQRRLGRLRLPATDATHPATQLRADLLRALPYRTAVVTLDAGRAAAIDSELAGVRNAAAEFLRKRYA